MKKIKGIILVLVLMMASISSVFAFDISMVNLSDEISHTIVVVNNIGKIYLPRSLRDNNSQIYYQLVETTESSSNEFTTRQTTAYNALVECKTTVQSNSDLDVAYNAIDEIRNRVGENYLSDEEYIAAVQTYNNLVNQYKNEMEACVDEYNASLDTVAEIVPPFDNDNWQVAAIDLDSENADPAYNIQTNSGHYWLWIKAKDANNEDIYQVLFLDNSSSTAESSGEAENIYAEESSTSNAKKSVKVPSTSANASYIVLGVFFLAVVAGIGVYMFVLKKYKKEQA